MTPCSSPSAPKPVCPAHRKQNPAGGEGGPANLYCTCKAPKPVKPTKAWAIVGPDSTFDFNRIRRTRWEAWECIASYSEMKKAYQKMGFRCIRVLIQSL